MWSRVLLFPILLFVIYGQETPVLKGWLSRWATKPNIPVFKHGNKTYFLGSDHRTFLQAMQLCDIMYMKLLTIDSEEENDIIHKYIVQANKGNDFWTAGSNLLDYRNFVWMGTGKTVEYTKWNNNEPSYNEEKCIELINKNNQLLWNDIGCDNKINYICQREDNDEVTSPAGTIQPSYSPNINLLQKNGKTYYFSRDYKLNYLDAAFVCRMLHMTLVTITSEEENQVIGEYIRNTNLERDYWTAGTRALDNVWTWLTNGQHIEYTKWAKDQPNSINEKCIAVVYSEEYGLQWHDYPCNEKFPFICEKTVYDSQVERKKRYISPQVGQFEDQEEEEAAYGISDEDWMTALEELPKGFIAYTYNAGKQFHIETEFQVTQKQAKMFCEYHGMQLLTVESELENNITKKVLLDVGDYGPFWIGAKKPTNDWKWLRINKPLVYTNLEPHSNLATEGRTCLSMMLTGEWRLEECEAVRPFICEAAEAAGVEDETHNIAACVQKPAPLSVPVVKKVCAVKPIINVYINNNLVSSGADSKVLEDGHKIDGKYSVDIQNNLKSQ